MLEALQSIEAGEMLMYMSAADFPHLNKNARESRYKSVHKMAFPASDTKDMSLKEFSQFLAGRVING